MHLRKHPNGSYYAHLIGSNPVNLKCGDLPTAERLAKAANLEALEFANRTNMLTAEVVQRLRAGGKVNGLRALDQWRDATRWAPSTKTTYEIHIRAYLKRAKLDNVSINAATEDSVDKFVNGADKSGARTRTVRLAALQDFFKFTHARGLTVANPATLLTVRFDELTHEQKEPRKRTAFTEDELVRLSTVDDRFWAPAIVLGEQYGLRLSDVIGLEWASFDKPGSLIVWTDKHDKRIEMPLVADLISLLPGRSGRMVFNKQQTLSGPALSQQFSRLCAKLGMGGKTFHCLRHTFATRRRELGDTVDQIREKMGHSNASTTSIYIHNT